MASSSSSSYVRMLYCHSVRSHHHPLLGGGSSVGVLARAIRGGGHPLSSNTFWPWRIISSALFSSIAAEWRTPSTTTRRLQAYHPQSSLLSSPWLMIPSKEVAPEGEGRDDNGDEESLDYCFYRLADKGIVTLKNKRVNPPLIPKDARCVGSSHGWLAYLCCSRDCSLLLTNPVSLAPLLPTIPLPPITTLPSVLGIARSSHDGSIVEYMLRNRYTGDEYSKTSDQVGRYFVTKLVMSSSPDRQNCTVMAIQGEVYEIAFCRPGDASWTDLDQRQRPYVDIVYSNKDQMFYALSDRGGIEAWDLKDPSSPKRIDINPTYIRVSPSELDGRFENSAPTEYLVESCGDVLLVVRRTAVSVTEDGTIIDDENDPLSSNFPYKTVSFDVYRPDLANDIWEHVECLGDRVLFLGGPNHSFSLSALDFPELTPNSIYFTDGNCDGDFLRGDNYAYGGHDLGVYNLQDGSITPHYPCQLKKIRPTPIWVAPNPC